MNHYEIMSLMDENTLKEYFGSFLVSDILKAFASAFGSPQILVYERNAIDYFVNAFVDSDEGTRQKICLSLDGISVTPDPENVRRIHREIRNKEILFRRSCRSWSLK